MISGRSSSLSPARPADARTSSGSSAASASPALAPERAFFGDNDLVSGQQQDVLRDVVTVDERVIVEQELGGLWSMTTDDLHAAFAGERAETARDRDRVEHAHLGLHRDRPLAGHLAQH